MDTVGDLALHLAAWTDRLMPDGPRRTALSGALRAAFDGRPDPVTAGTCREIEEVAQRHSRHLVLSHDAGGTAVPDGEPPGWPPPDFDGVRRRGGGVTEVRRAGDAVVLRLDGLEAPEPARPYLAAAFALAAGARRMLLDLRGNGGGDVGSVALLAGGLLGPEPVPLCRVRYRDRERTWLSEPAVPPLPAGVPVDVLTSAATFSSAELLAHLLQVRGRARVVGERTPGGSDHVTPVQLTATVRGLLPEAEVTELHGGGTWEGVGVVPDLPCEPDRAVEAALGG